ncbi:UNVERIFIED_CONTAM: (-)-alpha-terpineol synthase [Sesamum radiatum]|uniref:(-)-alpha-terpineol synthase n=1 Tax=Sesamum radiatum TaxID=300843 RepID=A0AAW2RX34_SESRA
MAASTITMKMLLIIPNQTTTQNLDTFASKKKTLKLWCMSSSVTAATACFSPSLQLQRQHAPPRRSGNYGPSLWDYDYIQSLNTQYAEERYLKRVSELKVEVKKMLVQLEKELPIVEELLELVDELQRVGISYHFEDEINQILASVYDHKYAKGKNNCEGKERDLYSTALEFRLLRQHGFTVSQEIFDCFRNDKGDFDPNLGSDTKGEFATDFLQKNFDENIDDENLALMVCHALELPIHWRVERPNARWFIEAYEKRADVKSVVLELAKLDFNIVQATHQQELKHIYEWWKQTGLAEKLPFARDRIVECYFWAVGFLVHPQYGYARTITAKGVALVLVIDDIFDVYGTPEELQLFNNALQRACMQEAEWYLGGYAPILEEYMNNAWISSSVPVVLFHAYFLVTNPTEEEAVRSLYKYHGIIQFSAMIFRLANDLATSPDEMKRGDVPKLLECYMNESGGSREEAIEYARIVMDETWKKMNQEAFIATHSPFPQHLVRIAFDVGRMAQYMYQHGTLSPQINHSIAASLFLLVE